MQTNCMSWELGCCRYPHIWSVLRVKLDPSSLSVPRMDQGVPPDGGPGARDGSGDWKRAGAAPQPRSMAKSAAKFPVPFLSTDSAVP